jgi:hypothetical protein
MGPINPVRNGNERIGRSGWYPYYAGFSSAFASDVLKRAAPPRDALILDPWNGGGTTTFVAQELGFQSWGGDLNPVMIVVARARMLSEANCLSVLVLAEKILSGAVSSDLRDFSADPLSEWLSVSEIRGIRQIEVLIVNHVVPSEIRADVLANAEKLSEIAAFLYLALFLLARDLARHSKTSNPTWRKKTKRNSEDCPQVDLNERYVKVIRELLSQQRGKHATRSPVGLTLQVASSTSIPLSENSAHCILTSPPYCTRIDYAVSTALELAILGADKGTVRSLRLRLMGTTTIKQVIPDLDPRWGGECNSLLEKIRNHPSHASAVYYYKSHIQYFSDLFSSISEIERVLRSDGVATFETISRRLPLKWLVLLDCFSRIGGTTQRLGQCVR